MKLLVVRHGQTDANVSRLLQGNRLDQSLNKVGREQARAVLPLLKDEQVNVVYSSQLRRACETAEIIAEQLELEIKTTKLLNEKDFGNLTNKTWDQVHKELANEQLKEIDRSHAYDYRPYGGESVDQVRHRIKSFLDHLKENHTDEIVLTVTHGGIVRLLNHMLEIKQPPHVENASLHRFNF